MRAPSRGISLLLSCVLLHALATAQTTYDVDPAGNNLSDGRSPHNAWRTVGRVNRGEFKPGDSILFKRSGTWYEELRPPASGAPGRPVTYGAYGAGPGPVIDAGGALAGWDDPGRWVEVAPDIWQTRTDLYPGRLWLSGREYGTCGNTKGGGSTTPDARYRWWGNGQGILEVYSPRNPALEYRSMEVANKGRLAMRIERKQWLRFIGMTFRRGEICIDVLDGDNLLFDSCTVLAGTAKYGLWLRGGSDFGEVRNCLFDREDTVLHPFQFAGEAGDGNGQDNIALQYANGWNIHHSVIANPGHDAVSLSGEQAGDETWRSCRNSIHHNLVWMAGDYGRFTSTNGKDDPALCSDNEIYCNVIRGMTVQSQILGRHNLLHDNLFRDSRSVPWEKTHWHSCVVELSDYLNAAGDHNCIWYNTIVNADANAISVRSGTRRASVRNNLIVNTGNRRGAEGQDFLDHVGIVLWPGAVTDTIVDNVIWCGGQDPVVYREPGWDHNTKRSVSWFNAQNGKDGNVIHGNISVDPRLDARLMPRNRTIKAGRRDGCER
ncbi:MAG TPA: right-handed parallel beta-helix repeat-containing protein [Bacteroidota bacterium]